MMRLPGRWIAALALLVSLAGLAMGLIEPRADPQSLFGDSIATFDSLDGHQARLMTVAFLAGDVAARSDAARRVAAMLNGDPRVARVRTGQTAPDLALVEWVWTHRLHLGEITDLSADAMAARLVEARLSLTTAEGLALGRYTMRDPTGAFRAALDQFASATLALPVADGVWQARDDTAALMVVELADTPFDPSATLALIAAIRGEAGEIDTRVLGPRAISARIGAQITGAALIASALGFGLLLAWLTWVVRSTATLLVCLMPLALGLAVAALSVQLFFGSVHVLALGFGGALTGLALDYSLHLLGHGGALRMRARRLVLLGAVTTIIVFLALLGAGLPAFAETGVFVAVGLGTAVLAARALVSPVAVPKATLPFERLFWQMPLRPAVSAGLAVSGIAVLVVGGAGPERFSALPPDVIADIEAFREMLALPSGRHQVLVEGTTPDQVLTHATPLVARLDRAVAEGRLSGFSTLAQILPSVGVQESRLNAWPGVTDLASPLKDALVQAGFAPAFATEILAAYDEALHVPPVRYADLAAYPDLAPLIARMEDRSDGWQERVLLYGVTSPDALTADLQSANLPGVTVVDTVAEIDTRIATLRHQVLLWLALGAAAAGVVLAILSGVPRRVGGLLLHVGGAMGLTVLALTALTGPLSVFQLMALTLVAGIGLDYGLFLSLAEGAEERTAAARSAGLCALSTLLVFGAMAISPAAVLAEIGLTVTFGVLAILALSFGDMKRAGSTV